MLEIPKCTLGPWQPLPEQDQGSGRDIMETVRGRIEWEMTPLPRISTALSAVQPRSTSRENCLDSTQGWGHSSSWSRFYPCMEENVIWPSFSHQKDHVCWVLPGHYAICSHDGKVRYQWQQLKGCYLGRLFTITPKKSLKSTRKKTSHLWWM